MLFAHDPALLQVPVAHNTCSRENSNRLLRISVIASTTHGMNGLDCAFVHAQKHAQKQKTRTKARTKALTHQCTHKSTHAQEHEQQWRESRGRGDGGALLPHLAQVADLRVVPDHDVSLARQVMACIGAGSGAGGRAGGRILPSTRGLRILMQDARILCTWKRSARPQIPLPPPPPPSSK